MPVVTDKVDCPDCRGPARARRHFDTRSRQVLGVDCMDCGYDTTVARSTPDKDATPADTPTPTQPAEAAEAPDPDGDVATHEVRTLLRGDKDWPVHEGAGWYTLSNGHKVRGKAAAHEQQSALDE